VINISPSRDNTQLTYLKNRKQLSRPAIG